MSKKPNFVRFRREGFNRPRFNSRPQKLFNPSLLISQYQASQDVLTPIPNPQSLIPNPDSRFADFNLHPLLLRNLEKKAYTTPTPIQAAVIPKALKGLDVVGLAQTGTGKTAAFLLPILTKLISKPRSKALIIAPTRELALQINSEFKSLSFGLSLHSAVCIGGVGQFHQLKDLRGNPQLVIGTPGRLKDFTNQRLLNLNLFNYLILDEVDQMLDMGFIPDIKYLLAKLTPQHQTLFFSATLPKDTENIMQQFLNKPEIITIAKNISIDSVEQKVIEVKGRVKVDVLHDLLIQESFKKVLVFLRTKHTTDRVAEKLKKRGLTVASIHGNKSQSQRQLALSQFKADTVKVLLATDIASRGLDIDAVSHVINYDLPETKEDYIHRIGRTARRGNGGVALTFID